MHDSSLKTNALGNQGQYGTAGGYRNTDNRGVGFNNADIYRGGLVHGGGAGGSVVGPGPVALGPIPLAPVASAPLHVQATGPVMVKALPVASGPAYVPGPPYVHPPRPSSQYHIPAPTKLYVDRPGYQNVLVAARR